MADFSSVRPKRTQRSQFVSADTDHTSKKPRFDPRFPSTLAADDDDEGVDPILDADEIGKKVGIKRNAVQIDGYDSDSSTENFDARAEAKAKGTKKEKEAAEDEDEDMFAESAGSEAEETRRGDGVGKKDKAVRFMKDEEIEGQEEDSKAGGHVSADFRPGFASRDAESSSESGDDEERDRIDSDMDEELGAGGKKKHAPKLDAFNMKAEQEEGRFDEAGNYVRKAYDPDAAQDAWLDRVSKRDIRRAREAHEKREKERREREKAEDAISLSEVLGSLIGMLEVGETPMEALVRHGKAVPKKKTSSYTKKKKQTEAMNVEPDPAEEAAAAKAKAAIDTITESASRLTDRGLEDVYDMPREMIMRQYKRETGEDWKDPNPPKWEFHWLAAPEDAVNGPYDEEMMRAWQSSGQFDAGAEFRRVGETEWSRSLDFD